MKTIKIDDEDFEWLKDIADEHDLDIADVVGEVIWRWCNEHKNEELIKWG